MPDSKAISRSENHLEPITQEGLYSLGYASRASADLSSSDVNDLVARASAFNEQHQITGILFYHKKQFFQYLEGPESVILDLMSRIEADNRHSDLRTIQLDTTNLRRFTGWSMMRVNSSSELMLSLIESTLLLFDKQHEKATPAATSKNMLTTLLDCLCENPIRDSVEFDVVGNRIIVIGASAGGMTPINILLKALPCDINAAILIATHLAPKHKTVLHTILERESGFMVKLAEEGDLVVPGVVHLIPPSKNLEVVRGRICISDQKRLSETADPESMASTDIPHPIDILFTSVAHQYRRKAIGVILSGSGTDGTAGAKALQEAGAIVLAQTPEIAEFPSMPQSIIDSGSASRILSEPEMARFILANVNSVNGLEERVLSAEDEDAVERILVSLAESGFDFTRYKRKTVINRIVRRLALRDISTIEDYSALITHSVEERLSLKNDLLICVTSFFRDSSAWQALHAVLKTEIIDKLEPGETLRIWVPGCATGEEAYTLAIVISEIFEQRNSPANFLIFATDLSQSSLDATAEANYKDAAFQDFNLKWREKYFVKTDSGFQVKLSLREKVIVLMHNLISDPPFINIHLACCRNVIIYMQPELQLQVMKALHFSLNKGGILFLGLSETTGTIADEFAIINRKWNIYTKRHNRKFPLYLNQPFQADPQKPITAQVSEGQSRHREDDFSMYRKSIEALCNVQGKTALVLNRHRSVELIISDSVGLLEVASGQPGATLEKLLVASLVPTIVVNFQQLVKLDQDYIAFSDIECQNNHQEKICLDMEILKLPDDAGSESWLLICARSVKQQLVDSDSDRIEGAGESGQSARKVQLQLKEEKNKLAETRQVLFETVRELEKSRVDQQNALEQLTTANEELQSTNEELQSVNEELYTVNFEYQSKIHELSDLTNDMDNLVECTQLGVIFISPDLTIRRYTEQAADIVDLNTSLIGCPVRVLTDNLNFPDLENKLSLVMSLAKSFESDIDYTNGSGTVHVGLYPYKIDSDLTQGAIITLLDLASISAFSVQPEGQIPASDEFVLLPEDSE